MKYFIAARPGPMPPSPEQSDASIEWLDVTWEVHPVLEFKEGIDTLRAKLAEAHAAMGGG